MFNNSIHKQILKKIKDYDEIVIARHVGPDPDAIASQTALRDIINPDLWYICPEELE